MDFPNVLVSTIVFTLSVCQHVDKCFHEIWICLSMYIIDHACVLERHVIIINNIHNMLLPQWNGRNEQHTMPWIRNMLP